jgi:hypothetical protein
MKKFEAYVDIAAPRSHVWRVMLDVERWPEWTPTVTSTKRLDAGPLRIDSRTHMVQPKLKPATWQVTELDEARGNFAWAARNPGVLVTAVHLVKPTATGCRATLSIEFSGMLAPLAGWMMGKITAEYVTTEAESLKRRCEA